MFPGRAEPPRSRSGWWNEELCTGERNIQQGSAEWIRLRRTCVVTASDFAAALGLSSWKSPQKLMRQKLGLEEEDAPNEAMAHGQAYEDEATLCYQHVLESTIGAAADPRRHVFRRLKSDNRFGGSPDRIMVDRATQQAWLLEVKCTYPPREREEVPLHHKVQVQGLLAIYTELPFADYVSYGCDLQGGDNDSLFVARMNASDELWNRYLYPGLATFASYYERRQEPPRTSPKTKKFLTEAIQALSPAYAVIPSDF